MTQSDGVISQVGAAVDLVLTAAGWRRVSGPAVVGWPVSAAAYEDPYSIVGVRIFPTLGELVAEWQDGQSAVTDLIGSNVVDIQYKAWDGYLLLITPAPASNEWGAELNEIRANTRRLRKLIVTGDDFDISETEVQMLVRLREKLAPLIPVQLDSIGEATDPLADLPDRLAREGINRQHVLTILEARSAGEPMVSALHESLVSSTGAG